jgi:succinate dehydrogenase / fumarate reductase, cytochrome b subunit
VTGGALSFVGLALLVWWLSALAGGDGDYEQFIAFTRHWFGLVVLIGITWAFFQHFLSGIRHLFTDAGQGFDLDVNKGSALGSMIASAGLTAVLWGYILGAAQ